MRSLPVLSVSFLVVFSVAACRRAPAGPAGKPVAAVVYRCEAGKTITAAFYGGETQSPRAPGGPATPGGSVRLALSDGRSMILPQTVSADGARYADAKESFVFWSKGDGAMVLENGKEKGFNGCVVVNPPAAK